MGRDSTNRASGEAESLLCLELSPRRARQAEAFFRKAGLEDFVTVQTGDATKLTREIKGPIDLAFIDCGYSNYGSSEDVVSDAVARE